MSGRTATAALDQGTSGITSAGLNATLVTPSYRWFRRLLARPLVQVRRNGTAGGTHPTTCRVWLRRRHAGNAEMILAAPLCPAVGRDVYHGSGTMSPRASRHWARQHAATIAAASYLIVGLSVLVHGLSAAPLVSRYATWYQAAADTSRPVMERQPAHEHRARGSALRAAEDVSYVHGHPA